MIFLAADVRPLRDPLLYQAAYRAVSPCRREKADRLRFDRDKRLSLGAALLLQYGLRLLGADLAKEPSYAPNGKPYFPSGPCFNLSHSGDFALCALSDFAVGCDAETVGAFDSRLLRRFCAEEREAILSRSEPAQQRDLFFRYWTLKESYLKMRGCGLTHALDSFCVCLDGAASVRGQTDCHFAEFSDLAGYKCALCAAEDCADTVLQQLSLPEILEKTI